MAWSTDVNDVQIQRFNDITNVVIIRYTTCYLTYVSYSVFCMLQKIKRSGYYPSKQANTMNKHDSWMMGMITYHINRRVLYHSC